MEDHSALANVPLRKENEKEKCGVLKIPYTKCKAAQFETHAVEASWLSAAGMTVIGDWGLNTNAYLPKSDQWFYTAAN